MWLSQLHGQFEVVDFIESNQEYSFRPSTCCFTPVTERRSCIQRPLFAAMHGWLGTPLRRQPPHTLVDVVAEA